jgi:hypothetical protein
VDGTAAAVILMVVVVLSAAVVATLTLARRFRELTIFRALLASLATLTLLAAAVWFGALATFGFPGLPRIVTLAPEEVAGIVQVGLGVAAGVGAAVALLVAYRKQRDNEAVRESDQFRGALAHIGSTDVYTRLSGVYTLRDMADRWPAWRQRCIDMLCIALSDQGQSSAVVRDAIESTLRDRFSGRSPSWQSSDITIANCELSGLDLSTLSLRAGRLTLRRVTVAGRVDLSGMVLQEGARIDVDSVAILGELVLASLDCGPKSEVKIQRVELSSGGVFDLQELSVRRSANVSLVGVDMGEETKLTISPIGLPRTAMEGGLSLEWIDCAPRSVLTMEGLEVAGGSVRIADLRAVDATVDMSGMRFRAGAFVRLDGYHAKGGMLTLAGTQMVEKSAAYVTDVLIMEGSDLNLSKVYNKSGSLLFVDVGLSDGRLRMSEFENEGEGSVFSLHCRFDDDRGLVHAGSGGNYGADAHIRLTRHSTAEPVVGVRISDFKIRGGSLELHASDGVLLDARRISVTGAPELAISVSPAALTSLQRATPHMACDGTPRSLNHRWDEDRQHPHSGAAIPTHDRNSPPSGWRSSILEGWRAAPFSSVINSEGD